MYLCHVNLMAGELTDVDSLYVMHHQDVAFRTTLDDDLRLIGRGAGFLSGLVVHCIFQLPTICCDLKWTEEEVSEDMCFLEIKKKKKVPYHRAFELLWQFPVVGFREC